MQPFRRHILDVPGNRTGLRISGQRLAGDDGRGERLFRQARPPLQFKNSGRAVQRDDDAGTLAGSRIGDVVTNRELVFLFGKGEGVNRGLLVLPRRPALNRRQARNGLGVLKELLGRRLLAIVIRPSCRLGLETVIAKQIRKEVGAVGACLA